MKGLVMSLLIGLSLVVLPSLGGASPSETEFNQFLKEIGWTTDEFVEYLEFFDYTIDDFETMDDLKDFLGPVLSDKNLNQLLEEYDLTLEEATELLISFGELDEGESILDVYTFFDDLDWDLSVYVYGNDDDYDEYDDLDYTLFNEIGLTDEELDRLYDHFLTIEFDNDNFWYKLDDIASRLIAIEEFETMGEITAEQIAELLNIYTELIDLLELDVKYFLLNEEEKDIISLPTLFQMTSTNGYDLLIELYNKQGEFLADILLTADMFGSDLIQETGKDLKKSEEIIAKNNTVKENVTVKKNSSDQDKPVTKTEQGAKLPKTATNSLTTAAYGFSLMLIGFIFYRRFRASDV